jgi:aspartate kinase
VIAAGFQGIDESLNITTLGRGGSDTTAVALAAALKADSCEIYTDVDGVYTTDPRVVPEARHLARISYDEMLELASAGAGVMHNRSIEFARKFNVSVHVRSSFSDNPGTIISAEPESTQQAVCGAAMARHEARVTVQGVPDRPGTAMAMFSKVAAKNVAMDMIVQNVGDGGLADISFTVPRDELPATLKAVEESAQELGAEGFSYDDDVSKISVVGLGMATRPGVAEAMFRALAERGINILMISTSAIKISVLVTHEFAQEALRTVHEAFDLEKMPPGASEAVVAGSARRGNNNTEAMLARLQSMEKLIVEDIRLDETQARVTVVGLPDIPGLAAQVFDEVAEAGINVDMIIQSMGRNKHANISFTVPRSDVEKALAVARSLSAELGCQPPSSCPQVAKLEVSGIGMRSHTSVASRLFQSLAAVGINVDMISTSEMRVNVVVDGSCGKTALETLRKEFADALM